MEGTSGQGGLALFHLVNRPFSEARSRVLQQIEPLCSGNWHEVVAELSQSPSSSKLLLVGSIIGRCFINLYDSGPRPRNGGVFMDFYAVYIYIYIHMHTHCISLYSNSTCSDFDFF